MRPLSCSLLLLTGLTLSAGDPPSLVERLGYPVGTRLLIVNCDDVGMCHAANAAVQEGMTQGLISSGTIMVPCPWFPEIAAWAREHPEADFGIHLTHTAEWRYYRWGPVLPRNEVPGLVDEQGFLWRSIREVYAHATPEEALAEGRAQIRRALAAGIDVTHLDSHMGTLQYDPRYVRVYLALAREFNLPLRMASQSTLAKYGYPELRNQFAEAGLVFPDNLIHEEREQMGDDVAGFWRRILEKLPTGVTELYIHAAKPTEELRAITGSWRQRGQEFEAFTHDPTIREVLQRRRIHLIGYRQLRQLQRRMRNATR